MHRTRIGFTTIKVATVALTLYLKVGRIVGVIADNWVTEVALVVIIKIAGLPPLKGFGAHRRAVKGDVGVLAIMRRSSAKAGPFGNTNSAFFTTDLAVGTGYVRKTRRAG